MNAGTVELKFQDGTAIKIKGSADFVAAVTTAILEISKERSSGHLHDGESHWVRLSSAPRASMFGL